MLIATHLSGFGANATYPPLIDVITSLGLTTTLKLALDAGDSASYSSGQSWLDRSGNGYDFFRGADGSSSTDDPTFNGSAGGLSSAEFWSVDGADFFQYDAANEAAFETWHKNAALFSWAAWINHTATNAFAVFGTVGTLATAIGVKVRMNADRIQILVGDGSATELNKVADNTLGSGWTFIGGSIDENGGDVSFFYRDGDYDQVGSVNTFDAAYPSPSSSSATKALNLMAEGGGNVPAGNGSKIAAIAIFSGAVLTKDNFDDIFAQTRGRYGI